MNPTGRLRHLLALGLAAYGVACLRHPEHFGLLDAVDLPIHETGHLVFAPFGEFLQFLGGTLLQVGFPLVFVGYFLRRRDRYAADVVLMWVAQNLWNVSVYVADARARRLPLVGGGEHDWGYLLGRLGLLEQDLLISRIVYGAGVFLFAGAVWGALVHAGTWTDDGAGSARRRPRRTPTTLATMPNPSLRGGSSE